MIFYEHNNDVDLTGAGQNLQYFVPLNRCPSNELPLGLYVLRDGAKRDSRGPK